MPKIITLRPDAYRTAYAISNTGYNLYSAVADIVDNSINAQAENVWVEIARTPDDNPLIYIWDDGYGMDEDGLINAMRYGSEDRDEGNDLGRFGMGLKSASTGMSRSLDVITRCETKGDLLWANWDMDRIRETNEWELYLDTPSPEHREYFEDKITSSTGTLVVWENVYNLGNSGCFDAGRVTYRSNQLKSHLALVFHRLIEAGSVNIYVNDEIIESWNPYALDEPDTESVIHKLIPVKQAGRLLGELEVKCHLLPGANSWSSKDRRLYYKAGKGTKWQGLYVYREDRILVAGNWLGEYLNEPHYNLCRFEVHFPRELDSLLELDVAKTQIVPTPEIMEKLRAVFDPARAAGNLKHRGNKSSSNTKKPDHKLSSNIIKEDYDSTTDVDISTTADGMTIVKKNDSEITVDLARDNSADADLVVAIPQLNDGILFEPYMAKSKVGVRLNQSHEFYQRVYLPIADDTLATRGLDLIMWCLAEIELNASVGLTMDQMEEFRYKLSSTLRKQAKQLPIPNLDED